LPQGSNIIKDFDRLGRLVIEVSSSQDLFILIDQIEENPLVEYAEPNIIVHGQQIIPNEYTSLTALQTSQWGLNRIRAPWAWTKSTGNNNILVSILDSVIPIPGRIAYTIYRWNNSTVGDHFYTADPSGEGAPAMGYVNEGIAGWVDPPY
jgi:Repeat of unknown function (DUF5648)